MLHTQDNENDVSPNARHHGGRVELSQLCRIFHCFGRKRAEVWRCVKELCRIIHVVVGRAQTVVVHLVYASSSAAFFLQCFIGNVDLRSKARFPRLRTLENYILSGLTNFVEDSGSDRRPRTPQGHLQSRNGLGVTSRDRASMDRFRNRKEFSYKAALVWVVMPLRACPTTRESLYSISLVSVRNPCHFSTPATQIEK